MLMAEPDSHPNPSILSHVSIGTNDFTRALVFYDAVVGAIGGRRVMEHPGAVAYGRAYPEFWIHEPYDGAPATVGNGTHIAFVAASKAEVDAFHAAGIAAGATDDGKPGPRPDYGEPYYGSFLRDPDGHKIEAAFWDDELARRLGMA
jgi:catechol 2,3-dioxygenase-like lactoylglutathione lyase family enzyme